MCWRLARSSKINSVSRSLKNHLTNEKAAEDDEQHRKIIMNECSEPLIHLFKGLHMRNRAPWRTALGPTALLTFSLAATLFSAG